MALHSASGMDTPNALFSCNDSLQQQLDYLSLVSKICSELETHLGFGEKVVAEFITDLGRNSVTLDEFDSKLKENGAQVPDYFFRTLLTVIHAILPPKSKSSSDKEEECAALDGKTGAKYKALAIEDSKDKVKEVEREIVAEALHRREENEDGDRRDQGDRIRDKRDRDSHRHRGSIGDFDNKDDGGDRSRGRHRWDRHERKRGYDSGCFVRLRGKEGLVHVSQIASRRIGNAKDVVKRNQEVYVKVISVSGQKLSLSDLENCFDCISFS